MGCKVKELRFGLHKCRTPDNAENAEKPYSIEVGRTKRTINLYAIASSKFQIAC